MVDLVSGGCAKYEYPKLKSKNMKKNADFHCIDFYYMMKGAKVGKLSLSMNYPDGRSTHLWERSGDQGDEWKQGGATLPITDTEYTVIVLDY